MSLHGKAVPHTVVEPQDDTAFVAAPFALTMLAKVFHKWCIWLPKVRVERNTKRNTPLGISTLEPLLRPCPPKGRMEPVLLQVGTTNVSRRGWARVEAVDVGWYQDE